LREKFSCQNDQTESHIREKKLKEWGEYEPDQFPDLGNCVNSPRAAVLLFIPMKVVLTEAKR
jgi:TATA-box binding protein (TBP) (component of TFIID and TFIIIB)